MIGLMLFSLLASYGVYSVVVNDSSDSSSDDSSDQDRDERLVGSDDDDVINASGGDDTVLGGDGNDLISGGAGDDLLRGEGWYDTISGDQGDDTLDGGDGEDLLFGGIGDDSIVGAEDNDRLLGGDGDDSLLGYTGHDWLVDTRGDNTLSGGFGQDVLISAGDFSDDAGGSLPSLYADLKSDLLTELKPRLQPLKSEALALALAQEDTSGSDVLDGGSSWDILAFGAGDTATGGPGDDTFAVVQHHLLSGDAPATITDYEDSDQIEYMYSLSAEEPDLSIEHTDTGVNLYDGGKLVMVIGGDTEDLTLHDITLSSLPVKASAGNDTLTGGADVDAFYLQDGNDKASGEDGNDTLYGGDGRDTLNGAADDDWLMGGDGSDTLNGGTGDDVLNGVSSDDIIGYYLSYPTQNGFAYADIQLNDRVQTDGMDLLNGGYGDDVLLVGAGDTAVGGEGDDMFVLIDHDGSADMAVVEDFDPSEDYLMVKYWDDESTPGRLVAPELTASVDEDGYTVLALDGKALFLIKTVLPANFNILNAVALEHYNLFSA